MRIPDVVVEELLADSTLTVAGRSIYLWAWALQPESLRQLARNVGASPKVTTEACRNLAAAKWMMLVESPHTIRPVALIPANTQTSLAQVLEAGYAFANNKGEYLMKCHLDMRVQSSEFVDNARPEFLESPISNYPLEYDRYYPRQGVAFEFNGAQHYGTTPAFADEQSQKETRARDLIKGALSKDHGVRLVTITSEDLRPGRFEQLLPKELTQRHVDEDGPWFKALARLSIAYANKAARPSRQGGTPTGQRQ